MKYLSAMFCFSAVVATASAQTDSSSTNAAPAGGTSTNSVRVMTLGQCITEALSHNFDVQVERYSPEISLESLYGSYGGWDPTLNASGRHNYSVSGGGLDANQLVIPSTVTDENNFNAGIAGVLPEGLQYDFFGNIGQSYGHYSPTNAFENSAGSIGVSMTQPLLKNFWTDSTRETIYVAKNRYKFSEQGLRQQLMTTVAAVENAYYELGYAYANVTVEQEALNLATQQLSDDQTRVRVQVLAEHGGTIEQDQAQVAQSKANLIAAQYALQQDENALKNLITDNYTSWHDLDIQPADKIEAVKQLFDVQDSWDKGLRLRPDLQQAKLNVEEQGIQLKFVQNQLFPELDLVGSFGYNGSSPQYSDTLAGINNGNEPFYSYGAQLSMPLSNVSARNNYKSSKAQKAQLLLQLKQLEQNVMVEIDNDVKNAEAAWESVDATRDSRIYAEVALQAEQQKYAVGTSTTFTVLQLQNNVTSARSQEIRTLANYNEALIQLAQQEGSILQSRNLDIEIR